MSSDRAERPEQGRAEVARRRLLAGVGVVVAVAVVAALVVVGLRSTSSGQGQVNAALDRETEQLTFSVPAFAGGDISTASLAGTPTVLNFYASWCGVCDAELPAFETVSQAYAGTVSFVGINPQSNDSDAAQAKMIERNGVTYPTGRDAQDDLLRLFNTTGGLPTTVFLDADGTVVGVHNGAYDEAGLTRAIEESFDLAPAA